MNSSKYQDILAQNFVLCQKVENEGEFHIPTWQWAKAHVKINQDMGSEKENREVLEWPSQSSVHNSEKPMDIS